MCAIFGIGFLKGCKISNEKMIKLILRNLFAVAQERGQDASGVAFVSDKEISVVKNNVSGGEFIHTDYYKKIVNENITLESDTPNLISIIGHCRAQTKGTHEDNHNNHPIVAGKIVGIHNGMISNDEEIWKTFQNVDIFERRGKVDSEIIFKLLDYYVNYRNIKMSDAIQKIFKALLGSFACAIINARNPWVLWLFKNHLPIDITMYPKYGLVMFATDNKFIKKAVNGMDLGTAKLKSIGSSSGICFNFAANKQRKFSFIDEALINPLGFC